MKQQGNFINVSLARHVSGTNAHHQEHWMLQLNIQCSWWWAFVPKMCWAKNTLIKLPCCIKLAFQVISWGRCTVKQPSTKHFLHLVQYRIKCPPAVCNTLKRGFKLTDKVKMENCQC